MNLFMVPVTSAIMSKAELNMVEVWINPMQITMVGRVPNSDRCIIYLSDGARLESTLHIRELQRLIEIST